MKKLLNTFVAASLALSLAAPISLGFATTALAATAKQICHDKATRKANKKTNKKVIGNALVGGLIGAGVGSAFGGRKTTAFAAAGGATLGIIHTSGKWQKYYNAAYENCMDDYN